MKHGWYSEKQAAIGGSSIYTTPNGGEVEVTEVRRDEEPTNFPDAVCRGEVVSYVRHAKSGDMHDIPYPTAFEIRFGSDEYWRDNFPEE